MIKLFTVTLPLPPSSNNIYFNRGGGGRQMTTEARSWKIGAKKEIFRQGGLSIQSAFDSTKLYCMVLYFWFDVLVNKGWEERYKRGKKKGQRKAETKWKKMDQTNRIKLAEDTIAASTGVDDSASFIHALVKDFDPDDPRLTIAYYEIEDSDPWPTRKL